MLLPVLRSVKVLHQQVLEQASKEPWKRFRQGSAHGPTRIATVIEVEL